MMFVACYSLVFGISLYVSLNVPFSGKNGNDNEFPNFNESDTLIFSKYGGPNLRIRTHSTRVHRRTSAAVGHHGWGNEHIWKLFGTFVCLHPFRTRLPPGGYLNNMKKTLPISCDTVVRSWLDIQIVNSDVWGWGINTNLMSCTAHMQHIQTHQAEVSTQGWGIYTNPRLRYLHKSVCTFGHKPICLEASKPILGMIF